LIDVPSTDVSGVVSAAAAAVSAAAAGHGLGGFPAI
jgi:hypothetical protein